MQTFKEKLKYMWTSILIRLDLLNSIDSYFYNMPELRKNSRQIYLFKKRSLHKVITKAYKYLLYPIVFSWEDILFLLQK